MKQRWFLLPALTGTGPSARMPREGCCRTAHRVIVSGGMSAGTGRARSARHRLHHTSVTQTTAMKQLTIIDGTFGAAALAGMPGECVILPIGTGLSVLLR